MKQRLNDLLSLSYVSRWAITPMFRQQTVAEHSFRVIAIALNIAEYMPNFQFTPSVMYWAMIHDATEAYTGDIPKPFKNKIGAQILDSVERQLCPWWANDMACVPIQVRAIVHLADTIEALDWVMKHGPDAKWKFAPTPDKLLSDVLLERIIEETQWYHFAHSQSIPGFQAAIEHTLEDLEICQTNANTSSGQNSAQVVPSLTSSSPKSQSKVQSKSATDSA